MKSYLGKEFTIISNDARIRRSDDLTRAAVYAHGDTVPFGRKVGDLKILPKRTHVVVTDVRSTQDKATYVLARPIDGSSGLPEGWTKATNLDGGFLNERCGSIAPQWALPPRGRNKTVCDRQALIRSGAPGFEPTGGSIPEGSFVGVLETSSNGKFVKICFAEIDGGAMTLGEEIGWTASSNLVDGCSDLRAPTACWRHGKFIGHKALVDIVGTGGEMEQITEDTLEPYLALIEEAAFHNLSIGIESGFRTHRKQQELYEGWRARRPGFNRAAEPGMSNHQHGQALDLNTRGFDGNPIYDWMKKHGPQLGFVRTVSREHWHWEYRPDDAHQLAKTNKYKLPNVID